VVYEVFMKAYPARLFAGLFLSFALVGCSEHADQSAGTAVPEAQQPERHIALQGQPNFRDLGGYATADGRTVRWGQVYRSGELPRLTDADVEQLASLDIQTVVDFLTEAERAARGPDRLPAGVHKLDLPMEAGNLGMLAGVVSEARQTGDFSQVPAELNPDIHRLLVVEGREYYATLLRELADPDRRPLVFHCSHGIHRTGTAAAILLSALGVPWETVREDYLLSNDYRRDEIERRVDELRQLYASNNDMPVEQVDSTNIEAFYILQGSYIDAALQQAIAEYGSMDAYIRDGLGISNAEVLQLQQELLEP
jgi:protein-tyrosine phosphatase